MQQAADDVRGAGRYSYLAPLRYRALTRFYDRVVATTTRSREWIPRVAMIAAVRPREMVLDIGCGTGTLLGHLQEHAGMLLGLDADSEALALASPRSRAGRLAFARGFAQQLPFADTTFDLVVSSLFFHHLSTMAKQQVLREIRRVLHPHGRLVIADWGLPAGMLSRAGFCLVRVLDGFETTRDSARGALPQLIAAAGFEAPREHGPLSTPLGTIRFWETRPAAS